MKINHKPKQRRTGLGQTLIIDFKSKEELTTQIKDLEEKRTNKYTELIQQIHTIQLDYKRTKLTESYNKNDEYAKEIDSNYKIKKDNATQTYNEYIKPIDKKLKELRITLINRFNKKEIGQIDKRLKTKK